MRTSTGCWTCRLRRKKCDETPPVCRACAALEITCHFDKKPPWMDGGTRQEEMIKAVKRSIKEKAQQRREGRPVSSRAANHQDSLHSGSGGESISLPPQSQNTLVSPCNYPLISGDPHDDLMRLNEDSTIFWPQQHEHGISKVQQDIAAGWYNTNLVMFYLDHLLPFLLPFYRPPLAQGGRAWIFQLTVSSPVVRQATLCLSSYFFSLARGKANHEAVGDKVLKQTGDTLRVLRRALQYIDGCDIMEHLHGAVRIMASIIHVLCYELAILSFDSWQAHLHAAMTLFIQLLETAVDERNYAAKFDAVIVRLGNSSSPAESSDPGRELATAEQAAFRFSSALIMFIDIISSTVFQERPRLHDYHEALLGDSDETGDARIDFEAVVGIQNWILRSIGDISALDAWKHHRKSQGDLDIVELVHRAQSIRELLLSRLVQIETDEQATSRNDSSLFEIFTTSSAHHTVVSRVWAHAAMVYLSVVLSGWQPASPDVRYRVNRIIDLLEHHRSQAVLRTTIWPLCVAGCLAESTQEHHFRELVHALQPSTAYGTVYKALEIMETVWSERDTCAAPYDLASCFRSLNENVLLI